MRPYNSTPVREGELRPLGLVLISLLLLAAPTKALAGFDQNRVIDDDAFTNSGSMSPAGVQKFLNEKGGVLANYAEGGRTAAAIIIDAANANGINPQVLLATLQKEQSLITLNSGYNTAVDPDGRLRKAMGYACPDSGSCDSKYAGFTKQVDGAAFQFRYNYDGSTVKKFTDYQLGQTMTFDGSAVFLANQATASLYRYTPHISGNRSFYNTFFTYFLEYSSRWSSQNGFPTLAPGDSYKFSAAFENGGNKAWDRNIVKLGTDQPKDRISAFWLENRLGNGENTMWNTANRVALRQSSVPIGQSGHFDFYMTVPLTMAPGTYKEYFRPVAEGVQWLDDQRVYWDIIVVHHQSVWAGQNFGQKTVEPGQSFQLEVKLRNSGQTIWRRDGQSPVRLGTSRNKDRVPVFSREDTVNRNPSGWTNPNRVAMVESSVAPGEIATFRFWYTTPNSIKPGTYREYFQPVHENVRWMEDLGIYFDIVVGAGKVGLVSQSGYPTLSKGESAKFSLKLRNDGTSTWQRDGDIPFRLATARAIDRIPAFIREDVPGRNPSGWVMDNRVALAESSVPPGEIGTFEFWYTVPSDKAPGTYREFFNPVRENYGHLNDLGIFWDVSVR